MNSDRSSKKIDAIYNLRAAAEAKATAEVAVETHSTPGTRDALLDAQIELEAKTADAVDACHACDDPSHAYPHDGGGRPAPQERGPGRSNVIEVDFGGDAESA